MLVLLTLTVLAQSLPVPAANSVDSSKYTPGSTFQTSNPNYPIRNPFYFEGRVDWNLLKIVVPANAWEFAQRGIHEQDDMEDIASAIADYTRAISMNSLSNGTCQLITASSPGFGQSVDPPPCMFTVRLRLGNLLKGTNPSGAIDLFQQVLQIDPLRLGVNALIGDAYRKSAEGAKGDERRKALHRAIAAYRAELALSPVTPQTVALTGDLSNNAHVHWTLAEVYRELEDPAGQVRELTAYLEATQWHSDTNAWRIPLARSRLAQLQAQAK